MVRGYAHEITPVHVGDREYRFLSAEIKDRVLEPLLVTVKPTIDDCKSPTYTRARSSRGWSQVRLFTWWKVRTYHLGVGDCIHVDSTRSHGLRNETDQDASVLWVLSQPLVQETLGELTRYHMSRVPNRPKKIKTED